MFYNTYLAIYILNFTIPKYSIVKKILIFFWKMPGRAELAADVYRLESEGY